MSGHTPGPWRVEDPLGPDILSIVAGSESPAEWVDVAQLSTDGSEIDPRESAANAALIAAAPELAEEIEQRRAAEARLQDQIAALGAAALLAAARLKEVEAQRDALADAMVAGVQLAEWIEDHPAGQPLGTTLKEMAEGALVEFRVALRAAGKLP